MVDFSIQTKKERARKRLRATTAYLFSGEFGCADASCIYGDAGGQHTNGGCNCLKDPTVSSFDRDQSQNEWRRIAKRLSAVALDLAEQVLDLEKQAIKKMTHGHLHGDHLCSKCEITDGVLRCAAK